MPAKLALERRQIRRAAKDVELVLGLALAIPDKQELARHDVGREERRRLGNDDHVDHRSREQVLQTDHEVGTLPRIQAAANGRQDSDIHVRVPVAQSFVTSDAARA